MGIVATMGMVIMKNMGMGMENPALLVDSSWVMVIVKKAVTQVWATNPNTNMYIAGLGR